MEGEGLIVNIEHFTQNPSYGCWVMWFLILSIWYGRVFWYGHEPFASLFLCTYFLFGTYNFFMPTSVLWLSFIVDLHNWAIFTLLGFQLDNTSQEMSLCLLSRGLLYCKSNTFSFTNLESAKISTFKKSAHTYFETIIKILVFKFCIESQTPIAKPKVNIRNENCLM